MSLPDAPPPVEPTAASWGRWADAWRFELGDPFDDFDAEAPYVPTIEDEEAAAAMSRPTDDELAMLSSTGTI
jgi:hypothetical protein